MIKLYILILLSNTTNIDKIKSIYYINKVEEIRISSAIIKYETGRMNCNKCAFKTHNNLFGFMWKNKYIKYNFYNESIKAYIKWQKKHWLKFHKKYPNESYYKFLKYIYYCDKIDNYILIIKSIERYG